MFQTFEEAKEYKLELETTNIYYSNQLKSFENNAIGIVPDHIREQFEYKEAKKAYDHSFIELQNFNTRFIKTFKKEYALYRKENRK